GHGPGPIPGGAGRTATPCAAVVARPPILGRDVSSTVAAILAVGARGLATKGHVYDSRAIEPILDLLLTSAGTPLCTTTTIRTDDSLPFELLGLEQHAPSGSAAPAGGLGAGQIDRAAAPATGVERAIKDERAGARDLQAAPATTSTTTPASPSTFSSLRGEKNTAFHFRISGTLFYFRRLLLKVSLMYNALG
ncbi:MAG: hypothetical protein ABFQ53_02070, partial [Patescibacteria group bacterium]